MLYLYPGEFRRAFFPSNLDGENSAAHFFH
jgi:hypothetical protein